MLRFLIPLFLLTGVLPNLCGQVKDGTLINYSQENGLPSDEAYCVFKDSKGYIWIATDQGVVRHKGESMEVIRGLPDNVVFKIREDSKGRVWFFSRRNELSYYLNGKVYLYAFMDSVREKAVNSLVVDANISSDDKIYLNLKGVKNLVIDINSGRITEHPYVTDLQSKKCTVNITRLTGNSVPAQKIWAGINKYDLLVVNIIDHKDTVTYSIPRTLKMIFSFYGVCQSKNGDLFFFGGESLVQFKKNGGYNIINFYEEILSITYDEKSGIIYAGLRGGGVRQVSAGDFTLMANRNLTILNDKSVTGIAVDGEEGLWFSTLEHGVYYSRNNELVQLVAGKVTRMHYYMDSLLLFGTHAGIFVFDHDSSSLLLRRTNESINDMVSDGDNMIMAASLGNSGALEDHVITLPGGRRKHIYMIASNSEFFFESDTILLITQGGRLFRLLYEKGAIKSFKIQNQSTLSHHGKLYLDYSGQLWFCGVEALFKYDRKAKDFRMLQDSGGLLTKGVTCMRQVSDDIYAAGISFSGLVLMQHEKIIGHITEKNGLLSNSVRYILVRGNRIWLAMSNGISVVTIQSYAPLRYAVHNFGEHTGIGNMVIYQLAEYGNDIVFASSKGLYRLQGADHLIDRPLSPLPIYITGINYYKGDTAGISSITLPYRHNQLTVNFDAISYNAPGELRYYYRMPDGPDTAWRSLQSSQIVLGNLTPGRYTLQVKAELPRQNRVSVIRELEIIIEKPWWQWNAVRIGALLLFLLIVYYIYNRRVKAITREKEKTAIQTEMAELKQVALRSQMNPHFIFNCLASIQQLVVAGSRDEANEYLVKFSRLIRKTLELSIRSHISLAEEKEYISEYLELEQLRIPGQFEFHFTIDNDINTDRTEIPNMMLQPIVENCVRHGIKHLEDRKGIIDIRVSRFDGYLRCEVTDNGVGRKEKSPGSIYAGTKSFGLGIVEKRLTGLAGYDRGNYFIKVTDKTNKDGEAFGTKVILQLPLKIRDI